MTKKYQNLINFNIIKIHHSSDTAYKFNQLSQSRNPEIRQRVAEDTSTPSYILTQLARDDVRWVRANVANNPKTPVLDLIRLSQDREPMVRACVAKNPRTPVEIIEKLSRDPVWWVAQCVAENPYSRSLSVHKPSSTIDFDDDEINEILSSAGFAKKSHRKVALEPGTLVFSSVAGEVSDWAR